LEIGDEPCREDEFDMEEESNCDEAIVAVGMTNTDLFLERERSVVDKGEAEYGSWLVKNVSNRYCRCGTSALIILAPQGWSDEDHVFGSVSLVVCLRSVTSCTASTRSSICVKLNEKLSWLWRRGYSTLVFGTSLIVAFFVYF
jgi:hypothetical protein